MIRQEKEMKGLQIRKEDIKLLFADDIIGYIENSIVSTKRLIDWINEFGKIEGYKVNIQKSMVFLYTHNQKEKLAKKNPIYYNNKKNKVPRSKFNQGGKRPVLGKLWNTEERN